jgi:Fe-S cluster assembly protein SufD
MSVVALRQDPKTDAFRQDFTANGGKLPGAGLAWLDARRRAAMEAFGKTGVPNRRVEAWKYTDLANALDGTLAPATRFPGLVADDGPFAGIASTRVVIVNGLLHRVDRYPPDGLQIVDLAALDTSAPDWVKDHLGALASGSEQPLGAVSLGLMRGGVAVRVTGEDAVLRLDFVNPSRGFDWVGHTRVLIVVEEGASLRLLESHEDHGGGQSLANIGMDLLLKANAKVEHTRVQSAGASALHVTSLGAKLARDAKYRALYLALGGHLARLDAELHLSESGARADLHTIAVLNEGIADTTTVMDHASPHTTSRQFFKSVAGGTGRSVAQGRVTVREGAVKSDSHQLFKALLMSPRAEADAKPELEIFADDVICGHGTAIGALDEDALFYLRARGIPADEARSLLIRAFLAEAMEGFGDSSLQEALWMRLDRALVSLTGSEA